LVLPEYDLIRDDFTNYLYENLLHADKIITISDFTKKEFLKYAKKNTPNIKLPTLVSIKLPYQYRNKRRIKPKPCIQDKVTILLPGTIEPRKQQILLMKLFIKFIKQNPSINVEIITFGSVVYLCKSDLDECICEANGQITYLGIVDNETLFRLYKTCTFLCFISKYEGYGFPISESLWHGMPVLTSNFGSMVEVASCGGCYCVDTTNEYEIYNALDELIKTPSIIAKLKNEINSNAFTNWTTYSEHVYTEIMKE
jgi:glycosyltransferase involved in cell wall biosynthesis